MALIRSRDLSSAIVSLAQDRSALLAAIDLLFFGV